ncbi:MAG: ATP-binding cassette domain-containing protein [Desulfovibrionaceae bacterium]
MPVPHFEIQNLDFAYAAGASVFNNASARIEIGEFVVLEGPSGTGKSTLLRLLCRLEEPSSGNILLRGRSLGDLDPVQLRTRVCLIQQTPTVIEGSVRANLLLPLSFKANHEITRPSDAELRSRLDDFLLTDVRLEQPAAALSVGQKQRLCLIRALLLSPEALLFDEPTSALDKKSAGIVMQTAMQLNREHGITCVLVTHALSPADLPGATVLHVRGNQLERA